MGRQNFPNAMKSPDIVELIKAAASKNYTITMQQANACNQAIQTVKEEVETLYQLPMGYETYFAMQRTGKLYQVKIPKYSAGLTTTECVKTLDNAGLVCIPSTDAVSNTDDYLNIPLFKWYNCNFVYDSLGNPIITAVEGDTNYSTTGTVDVGCFGMSFYWSYLDGADYNDLDNDYYYLTVSDSPNTTWNLQLWEGCKKVTDNNGTLEYSDQGYWCYSKYYSGYGTDGKLHSQPGLIPAKWHSHNALVSYHNTDDTSWGAPIDRWTYGYIMLMIKYATKSSQTKFAGCTSYNHQFPAAIATDTPSNYIILTPAQANNILVGSCVEIGYGHNGSGGVIDRGTSGANGNAFAYTPGTYTTYGRNCGAIVTNKENVTINNVDYVKVYVDITSANYFVNVPQENSQYTATTTVISTMPWQSGTTDNIGGVNSKTHSDGSMGSNTDSKHPYRIQGLEYSIGAWNVVSNVAMNINADLSIDMYIAKRGVTHITDTTAIQNNYILGGTLSNIVNTGSSHYIGDMTFTPQGMMFGVSIGSNASTGVGDYHYFTTGIGWRECLFGGGLVTGAVAGFCLLACDYVLSVALWSLCSCR